MDVDFNTVEECLEALRNGEIILVTDDADRENEGDCICAALPILNALFCSNVRLLLEI